MAVGHFERPRYPYLPIRLRIGETTFETEALVDTGLDGDLVIPVLLPVREPPTGTRSFAFATGAVVRGVTYSGTVQLGDFDALPVEITALGDETVIGRGVIDRYRVTFDHGERVIVEP